MLEKPQPLVNQLTEDLRANSIVKECANKSGKSIKDILDQVLSSDVQKVLENNPDKIEYFKKVILNNLTKGYLPDQENNSSGAGVVPLPPLELKSKPATDNFTQTSLSNWNPVATSSNSNLSSSPKAQLSLTGADTELLELERPTGLELAPVPPPPSLDLAPAPSSQNESVAAKPSLLGKITGIASKVATKSVEIAKTPINISLPSLNKSRKEEQNPVPPNPPTDPEMADVQKIIQEAPIQREQIQVLESQAKQTIQNTDQVIEDAKQTLSENTSSTPPPSVLDLLMGKHTFLSSRVETAALTSTNLETDVQNLQTGVNRVEQGIGQVQSKVKILQEGLRQTENGLNQAEKVQQNQQKDLSELSKTAQEQRARITLNAETVQELKQTDQQLQSQLNGLNEQIAAINHNINTLRQTNEEQFKEILYQFNLLDQEIAQKNTQALADSQAYTNQKVDSLRQEMETLLGQQIADQQRSLTTLQAQRDELVRQKTEISQILGQESTEIAVEHLIVKSVNLIRSSGSLVEKTTDEAKMMVGKIKTILEQTRQTKDRQKFVNETLPAILEKIKKVNVTLPEGVLGKNGETQLPFFEAWQTYLSELADYFPHDEDKWLSSKETIIARVKALNLEPEAFNWWLSQLDKFDNREVRECYVRTVVQKTADKMAEENEKVIKYVDPESAYSKDQECELVLQRLKDTSGIALVAHLGEGKNQKLYKLSLSSLIDLLNLLVKPSSQTHQKTAAILDKDSVFVKAYKNFGRSGEQPEDIYYYLAEMLRKAMQDALLTKSVVLPELKNPESFFGPGGVGNLEAVRDYAKERQEEYYKYVLKTAAEKVAELMISTNNYSWENVEPAVIQVWQNLNKDANLDKPKFLQILVRMLKTQEDLCPLKDDHIIKILARLPVKQANLSKEEARKLFKAIYNYGAANNLDNPEELAQMVAAAYKQAKSIYSSQGQNQGSPESNTQSDNSPSQESSDNTSNLDGSNNGNGGENGGGKKTAEGGKEDNPEEEPSKAKSIVPLHFLYTLKSLESKGVNFLETLHQLVNAPSEKAKLDILQTVYKTKPSAELIGGWKAELLPKRKTIQSIFSEQKALEKQFPKQLVTGALRELIANALDAMSEDPSNNIGQFGAGGSRGILNLIGKKGRLLAINTGGEKVQAVEVFPIGNSHMLNLQPSLPDRIEPQATTIILFPDGPGLLQLQEIWRLGLQNDKQSLDKIQEFFALFQFVDRAPIELQFFDENSNLQSSLVLNSSAFLTALPQNHVQVKIFEDHTAVINPSRDSFHPAQIYTGHSSKKEPKAEEVNLETYPQNRLKVSLLGMGNFVVESQVLIPSQSSIPLALNSLTCLQIKLPLSMDASRGQAVLETQNLLENWQHLLQSLEQKYTDKFKLIKVLNSLALYIRQIPSHQSNSILQNQPLFELIRMGQRLIEEMQVKDPNLVFLPNWQIMSYVKTAQQTKVFVDLAFLKNFDQQILDSTQLESTVAHNSEIQVWGVEFENLEEDSWDLDKFLTLLHLIQQKPQILLDQNQLPILGLIDPKNLRQLTQIWLPKPLIEQINQKSLHLQAIFQYQFLQKWTQENNQSFELDLEKEAQILNLAQMEKEYDELISLMQIVCSPRTHYEANFKPEINFKTASELAKSVQREQRDLHQKQQQIETATPHTQIKAETLTQLQAQFPAKFNPILENMVEILFEDLIRYNPLGVLEEMEVEFDRDCYRLKTSDFNDRVDISMGIGLLYLKNREQKYIFEIIDDEEDNFEFVLNSDNLGYYGKNIQIRSRLKEITRGLFDLASHCDNIKRGVEEHLAEGYENSIAIATDRVKIGIAQIEDEKRRGELGCQFDQLIKQLKLETDCINAIINPEIRPKYSFTVEDESENGPLNTFYQSEHGYYFWHRDEENNKFSLRFLSSQTAPGLETESITLLEMENQRVRANYPIVFSEQPFLVLQENISAEGETQLVAIPLAKIIENFEQRYTDVLHNANLLASISSYKEETLVPNLKLFEQFLAELDLVEEDRQLFLDFCSRGFMYIFLPDNPYQVETGLIRQLFDLIKDSLPEFLAFFKTMRDDPKYEKPHSYSKLKVEVFQNFNLLNSLLLAPKHISQSILILEAYQHLNTDPRILELANKQEFFNILYESAFIGGAHSPSILLEYDREIPNIELYFLFVLKAQKCHPFPKDMLYHETRYLLNPEVAPKAQILMEALEQRNGGFLRKEDFENILQAAAAIPDSDKKEKLNAEARLYCEYFCAAGQTFIETSTEKESESLVEERPLAAYLAQSLAKNTGQSAESCLQQAERMVAATLRATELQQGGLRVVIAGLLQRACGALDQKAEKYREAGEQFAPRIELERKAVVGSGKFLQAGQNYFQVKIGDNGLGLKPTDFFDAFNGQGNDRAKTMFSKRGTVVHLQSCYQEVEDGELVEVEMYLKVEESGLIVLEQKETKKSTELRTETFTNFSVFQPTNNNFPVLDALEFDQTTDSCLSLIPPEKQLRINKNGQEVDLPEVVPFSHSSTFSYQSMEVKVQIFPDQKQQQTIGGQLYLDSSPIGLLPWQEVLGPLYSEEVFRPMRDIMDRIPVRFSCESLGREQKNQDLLNLAGNDLMDPDLKTKILQAALSQIFSYLASLLVNGSLGSLLPDDALQKYGLSSYVQKDRISQSTQDLAENINQALAQSQIENGNLKLPLELNRAGDLLSLIKFPLPGETGLGMMNFWQISARRQIILEIKQEYRTAGQKAFMAWLKESPLGQRVKLVAEGEEQEKKFIQNTFTRVSRAAEIRPEEAAKLQQFTNLANYFITQVNNSLGLEIQQEINYAYNEGFAASWQVNQDPENPKKISIIWQYDKDAVLDSEVKEMFDLFVHEFMHILEGLTRQSKAGQDENIISHGPEFAQSMRMLSLLTLLNQLPK